MCVMPPDIVLRTLSLICWNWCFCPTWCVISHRTLSLFLYSGMLLTVFSLFARSVLRFNCLPTRWNPFPTQPPSLPLVFNFIFQVCFRSLSVFFPQGRPFSQSSWPKLSTVASRICCCQGLHGSCILFRRSQRGLRVFHLPISSGSRPLLFTLVAHGSMVPVHVPPGWYWPPSQPNHAVTLSVRFVFLPFSCRGLFWPC